jgi:hypothetical protein
MYKWNLEKLYNYLVKLAKAKQTTLGPFDGLFESALPENYDWAMVMKWARRAGKWTFRNFRADCLLTTPGPSAIFANLMMATTLSPPEFLLKPVHVASFLKGAYPISPYKGFNTIEVGHYTILVPKTLFQGDRRHTRRIAIVDDCVITGRAIAALRAYLKKRGYKPKTVGSVCGVSFVGAESLPETTPTFSAFVVQKQPFRLPWGYSYSFEDCFR